MKRISILLFLFSGLLQFAELSAQDTILPVSDLCTKKSFRYQVIKHEYIDNGNNFYIANTTDTVYMTFTSTGNPREYEVKTTLDDKGKIPLKDQDTLRRIHPIIEFEPSGRIKELKNWKQYRDLMVSFYSLQARANEITAGEFADMKDQVNHEPVVRRMMIEDLHYLFFLYGDTFVTDRKYLRVKNVRSPISDLDYYIEGTIEAFKLPGTKNTVLFQAKNQAGPAEKQALLEEAKKMMRKRTPAGEPVSEVKGAGLNSEQEYRYNSKLKRVMSAQFSDVLALDFSSRGNLRYYILLDVED